MGTAQMLIVVCKDWFVAFLVWFLVLRSSRSHGFKKMSGEEALKVRIPHLFNQYFLLLGGGGLLLRMS